MVATEHHGTEEPALRLHRTAEPHWGYDFGKRAVDIVGGSVLLLLGVPVMALAGTVVLITSGWPIFFGQKRMGLGGRVFTCWKFRTMVRDAESRRSDVLHMNVVDGPAFKYPDDPRVTRVGRWLRRTSIDELPQTVNILRGDMSLVGPRPLPIIENRYKGDQALRLSVKPGLTCIWQVSGRSGVTFEQWMAMDLEYVRTRSLLNDIRLILRTLPAVIASRGAV